MLLPFQGANTIRLALPRVSAHIVRLALGYVLLAFQAVPTQGVGSRCSPCPGLCAFGPSGRSYLLSKSVRQRDQPRYVAPRRVELRDAEVCLDAQRQARGKLVADQCLNTCVEAVHIGLVEGGRFVV